MEYRYLGRTGVEVSVFGLGTMMFGGRSGADEQESSRIIERCLDSGINVIDTADTYGGGDAERLVGQALGGRRDDVILTTKCFFSHEDRRNHRGGSRRWIMKAAEDSLTRLQTDRVDVFQLHRLDPRTDPEESLGALDDLVRQGKILYGGTSGAAGAQIVECQWIADRRHLHRPALEETQYSIFTRAVESEILPTCARHGLGVLVYGPLNGGWLTGKYSRGAAPDPGTRASRRFVTSKWWDQSRAEVQRKLDLVDGLTDVALDAGLTIMDIALGFAAAHASVSSVLLGPRTYDQLDTLLASTESAVGPEVLAAIDELVPPGADVDPLDFVRAPLPRR